LLGNGDGTFATEKVYYVPGPALALVCEDFTGDGKPDVVVGFIGDNYRGPLALFPGDETGRLGPPVITLVPNHDPNSTSTMFGTQWIAAADLNGDGYKDVVAVDISGILGAVTFLNERGGTFKQSGIVLPRNRPILSVALGDINEDGCVDAVGQDTDGLTNVNLGACDGTFGDYRNVRYYGTGDLGVTVALDDVDGDGHLDVITTGVFTGQGGLFGGEAGNLMCVLPGDGHGSFAPARVYRGDPTAWALAVADLNSDVHPDVIKANQDADSVNVFINDGQGNFGSPEGQYMGYYKDGDRGGALNPPVSGFRIADLDGDARPDLALLQIGRFYPEPLVIASRLNSGQGRFEFPKLSDGADISMNVLNDMVLADFRNTGRRDFLAAGYNFSTGTSYQSFAPGLGDGTFGTVSFTQLPVGIGLMGVGDFNRDGKLDFASAGGIGLTIYLGNGNGTFTPGQSLTAGGSTDRRAGAIFVGDFNRDGKLDLLVHLVDNLMGVTGHDVFEFLGNGDGSFSAGRPVLSNMNRFAVVDANKDGLPDIIESKEAADYYAPEAGVEIKVYLGRSDGTFALAHTYAPYAGVHLNIRWQPGPLVGDFNGDGNPDVAVFQQTRGRRLE
jgi:hypothetical protein